MTVFFLVFVQIPLSSMQRRTIVLQVADWDRFSKNDRLGEVQIPLDGLDFSRTYREWKLLQSSSIRSPTSKQQPPTKKSSPPPPARKSSSSSSSADEVTAAPATGPPALGFRLKYEHSSRTLLVAVLEARVS